LTGDSPDGIRPVGTAVVFNKLFVFGSVAFGSVAFGPIANGGAAFANGVIAFGGVAFGEGVLSLPFSEDSGG
jgi:hypothetical protein